MGDPLGPGSGVGEDEGGGVPVHHLGHVADHAGRGIAGGRIGILPDRGHHLDD